MQEVKNVDPHDKKLTPQALADHLQVPVSWIYKQTRMRGAGAMPMHKCGKYVRFDLDKVLEWSEKRSESV